jgi:hypothetical protein
MASYGSFRKPVEFVERLLIVKFRIPIFPRQGSEPRCFVERVSRQRACHLI